MIDWAGIAIVFGGVLLLAGPGLWWVFFRMDERPHDALVAPEPVQRLVPDDIAEIERALDVRLPASYVLFLSTRDTGLDVDVDGQSVLDDAKAIIDGTLEYRAGFVGLPPWPRTWVYVGDEGDACPYALDCETGGCFRLHKGDPMQPPLERHADFDAFLRLRRENAGFPVTDSA